MRQMFPITVISYVDYIFTPAQHTNLTCLVIKWTNHQILQLLYIYFLLMLITKHSAICAEHMAEFNLSLKLWEIHVMCA